MVEAMVRGARLLALVLTAGVATGCVAGDAAPQPRSAPPPRSAPLQSVERAERARPATTAPATTAAPTTEARRAPPPGAATAAALVAPGRPPTAPPEEVPPPGIFTRVVQPVVDGVARGLSDSVLRLQAGLLGRPPRPDELGSGVDRDLAGVPLAVLAGELLASPEYRRRQPAATTPEELVALIYQDLLDRAPDPVGLAHYTAALRSGWSPAAVAVSVSESAESVARTRTAPPEEPVGRLGASGPVVALASGDGVLAVGDSVMLGAAPVLQAALPGIVVDAAVSRQFATGIEILRARRNGGGLPGTIVVHLGTNGDVGEGACDALVEVAAGRRLILLTLKVPRAWEAPNNEVLRACAARHGASVAEWHEAATGLAGDGYHLTPEGARRYTELVAASL
jgi:hypothetical protein